MSLLYWWPFNNSATNLGIVGATLVAHNISYYSRGKTANYCAQFTSSNSSYFRLPNITLTSKMSFACWVNFQSTGGAFIIDCRSSELGYQPMYGGPGYGFQVASSNGNAIASWSDADCGFIQSTWYHIAVTITGIYAELFINGVSKGKILGSFGYNCGDSILTIGSRHTLSTGWLNGCINDLRIYNHILSTKEIKNLARGLMLHYDFENAYEQLDYIEGNGGQYIDTGIIPSTTLRGQIILTPDLSYVSEYAVLGADL